MDDVLQQQISEGEKRLRELIQKKEQVEALLQYQSGTITGHELFESYHNLTKFIEDFSIFLNKFRENIESPRGIGGNRDAYYYRAKKLYEQILAQVVKVKGLSARVQEEVKNYKQSEEKLEAKNNWETFKEEAARDDPLIDISGKASLQLQLDQEEQEVDQSYEDMKRMESDILKVNEMFTSLAGFVHEQGELTDRIEANVDVTYAEVESGNQQLGRAVGYKRSATRKKLIIAGVVLVILLIVSLIIYLSVRN